MRDIWNPWHGCIRKSEGCAHCYMYAIDGYRGHDGSEIYRTKQGFGYPVQRDRNGAYKVRSGEMLRVCMTSDFFLKEADAWRGEAWSIIRRRPDVVFFLLTKRPERVDGCLPHDWGEGWENVFFNVTCENQLRADERIPILHRLPFKHKGIMCAPLIGRIDIADYLHEGQIEQVLCGGENYEGSRPCHYEWVELLSRQCRNANVSFVFCGTGSRFVKDGKTYNIPRGRRSEQAFRSGLSFEGKPLRFDLRDPLGFAIPQQDGHSPQFANPRCITCGMHLVCNGCSGCGRCKSDE